MIVIRNERLHVLGVGSRSSFCTFLNNGITKGSFRIKYLDNCYEIWCFGIDSKYRGHKHGQRMLCECLQMFDDMPIELGCLKNNHRALHIYQKFGFVIVRDCGEYYWMRKEVK